MYRYQSKNDIVTSTMYHNQRYNTQNIDGVYHSIRSVITEYQHRKQKRKMILILCFSLVLILMMSICILSFSTQASSAVQQTSSKYFKSIEIEKGDTLWSIAQENMNTNYYKNVSEYIKEIKRVNTLASDNVKAGNYIIIPYYSEEHTIGD